MNGLEVFALLLLAGGFVTAALLLIDRGVDDLVDVARLARKEHARRAMGRAAARCRQIERIQ